MKHLYFLSLFTLALCLTNTIEAQENKASQNDKQVIVIKKTIDKDGQVTTERIITSGDEGEEVIVTVDSDGKHKVERIEGDSDGNMFFISSGDSEDMIVKNIEVKMDGDSEGNFIWVSSDDSDDAVMKNVEVNVVENEDGKVITIVSDGKTEVIELAPGAEMSDEKKDELSERGVHVIDHDVVIGEHGEHAVFFSDDNQDLAKKIRVITDKVTDFNFDFDFDFDFDHNIKIAHGGANCVALGVFVNTDANGGVSIQSIIDGSGAQDAGMESGDIIKAIGEDPVESYRALHVALSNYEPGEIVSVQFERDGMKKTVETELRAWGDLPNYEDSWRAQVKCGDEEVVGSPKVTKRIIIIKKGEDQAPDSEETVERNQTSSLSSPIDNNLKLENFTTFPNPTDGRFHVQFEAEQKPITVSVFDANGKEIYRDNVNNFDGYYNKEIDLRDLSRGALILSVAQDGKRHSEQIILQ